MTYCKVSTLPGGCRCLRVVPAVGRKSVALVRTALVTSISIAARPEIQLGIFEFHCAYVGSGVLKSISRNEFLRSRPSLIFSTLVERPCYAAEAIQQSNILPASCALVCWQCVAIISAEEGELLRRDE